MHFKEEIKYIISSKIFSNSKKRPKVIEGTFYAKKRLHLERQQLSIKGGLNGQKRSRIKLNGS